MSVGTFGLALIAPAKAGGGGFHLSSQLLLIAGIIAAIGVLAIIGWREGGARASRAARDVERNREIDE
jgi:hypothetical protein